MTVEGSGYPTTTVNDNLDIEDTARSISKIMTRIMETNLELNMFPLCAGGEVGIEDQSGTYDHEMHELEEPEDPQRHTAEGTCSMHLESFPID